MLNTFHGLPTHALIVHFTVVALPTLAITGIIVALWPWARRRYGVLVGLLAVVAAILTPITVKSGQDLYNRQSARFGPADVTEAGLMQRHMNLAEALPKWVYLLVAGVLLVVVPSMLSGNRRRVAGSHRVSVPAGGGAPTGGSGAGAPARRAGFAGRLELSEEGGPGWQMPVMLVGIVLTLVGGVLTLIMVARVGEAGAKAAWEHINVPTQSQSN